MGITHGRITIYGYSPSLMCHGAIVSWCLIGVGSGWVEVRGLVWLKVRVGTSCSDASDVVRAMVRVMVKPTLTTLQTHPYLLP